MIEIILYNNQSMTTLKLFLVLAIVAITESVAGQSSKIKNFWYQKEFPVTLTQCGVHPVYTPNFLDLSTYACFPQNGGYDQIKVKTPTLDAATDLLNFNKSSYVVKSMLFNKDRTKFAVVLKTDSLIKHAYLFSMNSAGAFESMKNLTSYSYKAISLSENLNYVLLHFMTSKFEVWKWEETELTLEKTIDIDLSNYVHWKSDHFISDDRVMLMLRGTGSQFATLLSIYVFNGSDYQQKFNKTIPSNESTSLIHSRVMIGSHRMIVGSTVQYNSSLCQFKIQSIDYEVGKNQQLYAIDCSDGSISSSEGNLTMISKGSLGTYAVLWFYQQGLIYYGVVHINNNGQVKNLTANSNRQLLLSFQTSYVSEQIQFYKQQNRIWLKVYHKIYSTFIEEYPCDNNYEWNLPIQTCKLINCTTKSNTIQSSNICDCKTGFLWSSTYKECLRDCQTDEGSTKMGLPNLECECLLYHFWDSKNLQCRPHCNRNLAIGVNSTDPKRCSCRKNAVWENNMKECVLKCENIILSTGQKLSPQICQCVAPSFWNSNTLSCDLPCTDIPRAAEHDLDETICICPATHLWNQQTMKCSRRCQLDPNSIRIRLSDEICICEEGFIWDFNLEKCIIFNCQMIKFSTGVELDGNNCECKTNFKWDPILRLCLIQCGDIVDNPLAGPQTNTLINVYECPCLQYALWEIQTQKCIINCSLYAHTTGNRNITACNCQMGFSWRTSIDPKNSMCQTNCGQKPGELTFYNSSKGHCECDQAYYWNLFKSACYRNCSNILFGLNMTSNFPDKCMCQMNSQWNTSQGACILNCINVFDAGLSTTSEIPKCTCKVNTYWSSKNLKCLPVCSNDPLSDSIFNSAINQCQCIYNAEWSSTNNNCTCIQGYKFNQIYKRCENAIDAGTISALIVGGTALIVSVSYAGLKVVEKSKKRRAEKQKENQKEVKIGSGSGINTEEMMKSEQHK